MHFICNNMEDSESETIFDKLNLNPQLFINEALNTVDDLVDEAFFVFHEEASTLLKTNGTSRSDDLLKGIGHICETVQADLDKNLGLWETHCLRNIFSVPEGLALPQDNELPCESSIDRDTLNDTETNEQLDSLRNKISMVVKETDELNRELRSLERQSAINNRCTESLNEVLELYDQSIRHEMFQEMTKTASELRQKMEELRNQTREEREGINRKRMYNPSRDMYLMSDFSKAELKDLEDLTADLKKIKN